MPSAEAGVDAADWYVQYRDQVGLRLRELAGAGTSGVHELWRYHMGWTDAEGRPIPGESGKLLRPVLCMTACDGYGGGPAALDVAASIELLHAFSLVHDDIEDGDELRRHRPTLWALVGVPIALNAGDGLFAKSFGALCGGMRSLDKEAGLMALQLFVDACLAMIEGQHRDIEFEAREAVSLVEYVEMVRGKTGAIIGAALALGAICGGAQPSEIDRLGAAGVELGLAFQATDDALALWGDPADTGKAIGNDLARGKKSLPLVLAGESGLSAKSRRDAALPDVLTELDRLGVGEKSAEFARDHADRARAAIEDTGLSATATGRLLQLIDFSVERAR